MLTTERMIDPEREALGEVGMLGRERWEEVHRLAAAGTSIRRIARELRTPPMVHWNPARKVVSDGGSRVYMAHGSRRFRVTYRISTTPLPE